MLRHHLTALLLATTTLTATACLSDTQDAPLDDVRAGGAEALLAPPRVRIAMHPGYPALNDDTDALLVAIVANLAAVEDVSALRAQLMVCLESGDVKPCVPVLGELGVSFPQLADVAERARAIVDDALLSEASEEEVGRAFRGAGHLVAGSAPDDELVDQLIVASGMPCDEACRDQLANGLGATHGNTLARLSQPKPSSGDNGGGGGGGGGPSAGTVIVVIKAVIDVIIIIEDWWWDSDEEDKECANDADCPSDEYCHKVGENDCRPKLGINQLCSRGGQCDSGRCVPYIGCGFLPCCRP
jgi:hypothetical protein